MAAIAAEVAVIFYYFLALRGETGGPQVNPARRPKFAMGFLCGLSAALFIGVVPIVLSGGHAKFVGLLAACVGVFLSIGVFELLAERYDLKARVMLRQQMRLLSVAVGTLAAFGLTRIS